MDRKQHLNQVLDEQGLLVKQTLEQNPKLAYALHDLIKDIYSMMQYTLHDLCKRASLYEGFPDQDNFNPEACTALQEYITGTMEDIMEWPNPDQDPTEAITNWLLS